MSWTEEASYVSAKYFRATNTYSPFTNDPMIFLLHVKATVGITANGSCKLITAFKISFRYVKSSILLKKAVRNVGTIAILLVKRTLFHLFQRRSKKPSIAN